MDDLVEGMKDGIRDKYSDDKDEGSEEDNVNDNKNQLQTFHSNSISTVELTDQGDLKIEYSDKPSAILKSTDITTNSLYQKLKTDMEKNNTKKLTKEELE